MIYSLEGHARSTHHSCGKRGNDNRPAANPGGEGPEKATSSSQEHSSGSDLCSYLAYLDVGGYTISGVHHPDATSCFFRGLQKHSRLLTGPGFTECEA